jgi:hypothetical protein
MMCYLAVHVGMDALALTRTISYHLRSIALPHGDDKEMMSKGSSKPRVT